MATLYTLIEKRNEIRSSNQEYLVKTPDGKIKYMLELDIIKDIELKGTDYRTDDNTIVTIKIYHKNNVKYLSSHPDDIPGNNLRNLLTYKK